MIREIKFRAWHTETQQMLPDAQTGVIRTFTKDGSYLTKECIYMQYTGLKDKNGKEIYERDVAKICDSNDRIMQCLYTAPYFWWENRTDSYSGAWSGEEIEIIGNIYENPDLLFIRI